MISFLASCLASALPVPQADLPAPQLRPLQALEAREPVWTSPSKDAAGSMPIGNGTCGANAWVEENGDLVLLLSRTDSWSETARLLKVGRLRVRCEPPLWSPGEPFEQRLDLSEGRIDIVAGKDRARRVSLWFEPGAPLARIETESATPHTVRFVPDNWRSGRRRLQGMELQSSWTMRDAPASVVVEEAGDWIYGTSVRGGWFHWNKDSIVPFTLRHQGLEEHAALVKDPLQGRIFGLDAQCPQMVFDPVGEGVSRAPAARHEITLAMPCTQGLDDLGWKEVARSTHAAASSFADSRRAAAAHWNAFWSRSWLEIDGDAPRQEGASKHPLRLGHDSDGANRLRGAFGRASVHAVALDEAQVARLAATRPDEASPVDEARLASWLPASLQAGDSDWTCGDARLVSKRPYSVREVDGAQAVRGDDAAGEWACGSAFDGSASFTLEAWVRLDADAGAGRIFDRLTAGGSDGFLFDTHPGRALRLILGARVLSAPDVLRAGRWTHVAATHDAASGTLALHVDGKRVGATEAAPPAITDGERITRGWILQRWTTACGGGGPYPIKFNGSIFTVDARLSGGPDFDPDWRKWGGDYWWQNTRLAYYPLLAQGSYESVRPLFDFYARMLPICKARAQAYYGAQGAYFPETVNLFGCYSNGDYGWNREGLDRSVVQCPYWQWAWQQGLELLALMLDWHEHVQDPAFLREELLPLARETLLYFESRFLREGKLVVTPTQAAETYWSGVVDDLPTVAGLRECCTRLAALGEAGGDNVDRARWARLLAACPPLPRRVVDGVELYAPARLYRDERSNCETPELYAVHPFRLLGVGLPGLEEARETWRRRIDKAAWGWTQDGICAARLGLADEARADLVARSKNSHPAHRLPVAWGPNFDWLPDQTHGGNLMLVAQEMLLQERGERLLLLPAWPARWSARFKLRAARGTTVEAEVVRGKLQALRVDPPARAKDVVVLGG